MKPKVNVGNKRINIAIIEPSLIVYEGISSLLLKSGQHYQVFKIDDLDEAAVAVSNYDIDLVIVNPSQIQNRARLYKTIKKNLPAHWVALVYSFFSYELLSLFDGIIRVTDKTEEMVQTINHLTGSDMIDENQQQETLSDRETEVLQQLVNGLSNKEIADKLNISIHTVISHRKNITQKTGIKSQSGLTIYALSNKIISLDNLS
jgi:DNA-binding NarL/FixJ family response regulator